MLTVVRGNAILVGVALVLTCSSKAQADPRTYCEAFARDIVDRKLLATGLDASPAAAGQGAGVATVATIETASLATSASDSRWRRAYNRSFIDCMEQYAVEEPAKPVLISQPKPPQPEKRPNPVAKRPPVDTPLPGSPEPGTQAWNDYCLSKHPSYDAKSGFYRTWSGSQRKCR